MKVQSKKNELKVLTSLMLFRDGIKAECKRILRNVIIPEFAGYDRTFQAITCNMDAGARFSSAHNVMLTRSQQ